jgi:dTDP-4-dehydrorhamnose 3,5-epimerase
MTHTMTPTPLPEVLLLEPKVFGDDRGFFFESFNQRDFQQAAGSDVNFVQDNHSESGQEVQRRLRYQIQYPQGKLVGVTQGAVFDVTFHMCCFSPNFGKWMAVALSSDNKRQLLVPPGFVHGFLLTSGSPEFLYKTTDYWCPEHERSLLLSDPVVGIHWPLQGEPKLSGNDAIAILLEEVGCFA